MRKQINLGLKLTSEQQKIVKAAISGIHVVNASAGCGKSTLINAAANYINAETAGCCSILVISYTKKTVADLMQKLAYVPNVSVMTFHSLFYRVLRSFGYKSFSFMQNEAEAKALMKAVIAKNNLYDEVSVEDIANAITKDSYPTEEIEKAAELFLDELKSHRKFTFDSLQYEMLALLQNNKTVAKRIQRMYSHVCIDEAQDLSSIQWKILQAIWPNTLYHNLLFVGDPNQAIYSFRGSKPNVMQEITDYYSAKVHNLTINFRCSSHDILSNANSVMPTATLKPALPDNGEQVIYFAADNAQKEAEFVCGRITSLSNAGVDLNDITILFRSGPTVTKIYDELVKQQIPFVKFGADAHSLWANSKTKRILGLVSYLHEPENRHWLHCCSPVFGIDAELVKDVDMRSHGTLPEALMALPAIAKASKRKFCAFLDIEPNAMNLREEIIYLWDQLLKAFFKEDDDTLLDYVLEATKDFASYDQLRKHLEDCRKQEKIQMRLLANPTAHFVRLMSMHTAKGMESNHVIMCGMADSLLTSHEETNLEEEKRILFVGMTRAKQTLAITYARSNGGHINEPIRFLKDRFQNTNK